MLKQTVFGHGSLAWECFNLFSVFSNNPVLVTWPPSPWYYSEVLPGHLVRVETLDLWKAQKGTKED